MSAYEDHKPFMDAQVDNVLGDSITYLIAGVPLERAPGEPTIPGFINLINADGAGFGGIEGINPHATRWTCKVHKQYLPDGPDVRHRIQHSKLPRTMRPAADTIDDAGDYYLFDLAGAP